MMTHFSSGQGGFRRSSFISLCLLLSACGGGGSDSGGAVTVSVSGTVGSGYQIAAKPGIFDRLAALIGIGDLQAQQALETVDRVVAIPTNHGNVDAGIYALIQQADIQANGGFSLNLDKSYDWVLLLVNSQARLLDQKVVAYISIPATAGQGIESIPVSSSTASNLDLGKVQPGSNRHQANSSTDTQTLVQKVSLSAAELQSQAQFDDSYRHLYNFYLNYDAATGAHYLPIPEARWTAAIPFGIDPLASSSSLIAFTYDGFYASVMTDSTPAIDFNRFCNSSDTLTVYPPAPVTIAGATFDMGNGMSNAAGMMNQWSSSYCGHTYLRIEKQTNNELMIQFPLGSATVPPGLWRMKLTVQNQEQTLAAFDFSLASPIDRSGLPTGFVPQFTLHPDPNDPQRITSISIEWYQNGKKVTDKALTDALVRNSFVAFVDYSPSGNGKEFIRYDNEGLISGDITPDATYAWYLATKPATLPRNAAEVTDLSISYEMAGISYRFTWSNGG